MIDHQGNHSIPIVVAAGVLVTGLLSWSGAWIVSAIFKRVKKSNKKKTGSSSSKLKASSKCVPLADGSGYVVRRTIPADNSCLFNAVRKGGIGC